MDILEQVYAESMARNLSLRLMGLHNQQEHKNVVQLKCKLCKAHITWRREGKIWKTSLITNLHAHKRTEGEK